MGCNCGRRASYPGVLTGVAAPTSTDQAEQRYEVTFPNGARVEFRAEWRAAQAVAEHGGVMRPIGGDAPTNQDQPGQR